MAYPEPGLEAILEEHSRKYIPYFEKRLRKLISVCTQHGILPVLITQPSLFGPGVDPVTQTDLAAVSVEGSSGYAKWRLLELYNDVTRRIGNEEDVAVIDLATDMPRNSLYYYDFLHYTEAGSEEVVNLIAPRLLPILRDRFPKYASGPPSMSKPR